MLKYMPRWKSISNCRLLGERGPYKLGKTEEKTAITETRRRIMDAAGKLFAEKGYTETTTVAIAKEAGVNETTIFRNFGNKKNLYIEIFCANTPGVEDILLNGLTNGVQLKQDLLLMFREYINTCVQHIPNYRLSVQQIDELEGQAFFRESANRFENMKSQMVSYLNMLKSFGKIVDTDCEALSEYLFSLFLIKAPQFAGKGESDPEENKSMQEEFAQECADYVYRLIAAET